MKFLTERHWIAFHTAKGFDGTKFEELVKELLPHVSPGEWQQTQTSWDGKRDFELARDPDVWWAECKMYKENVSINVLSPTLVMALIEQAALILFFSYSRINDNALRYLAQFGLITDKTIGIYDDEVLENAILGASPVASKYFADVAGVANTDEVSIQARLSQDVDVDYSEDERQAPAISPSLTTLAPFAVDVFIRNQSSSAHVKGSLHLEWPAESRLMLLEGAADAHMIDLPPTAVAFRRFYVKPLSPGLGQQPPRPVLDTGTRRFAADDLPPLNVSSLLAAPLIGADFNRFRDEFERTISARNCLLFAQVYGGSGTGKSRLLREFRDRLLAHEYAVHRFNGEDRGVAAFDQFVRRLLSKMYKLPLRPDLSRDLRKSRPTTGAFDASILDILYSDTFKPSEDRRRCLDAILHAVGKSRPAIIIDNIQNFDDATVELLMEIQSLAGDSSLPSAWVIGVNTDLMTSTSASRRLHQRVLDVSSGEPAAPVTSFHVRGFSEDDAVLYLRHVVGIGEDFAVGFTDVHEDITALILEKTKCNPLFLEQTLLHVEAEGGLERRAGRLYVKDIPIFRKTLDELPPRIRELIAQRWRTLQPRLPSGAERALRALSFLGSAYGYVLQSIGIPEDAIEELVITGMLVRSDTTEVRFYHNQHALYFEAEYGQRIDRELGARCISAIDEFHLSEDYFYPRFLLTHASGALAPEDVANAAARMVSGRDFTRSRLRAGTVLYELLNSSRYDIDPATEMQAVRAICEDLERQVAYAQAIERYRTAYLVRRDRIERYRPVGDSFFSFVYAFVDAQFATRGDEEAAPVIERALDESSEFRFSSESARKRSDGWLLNRLSVVEKTRGRADRAEAALQRSLDLANEIGDAGLSFADYVDWGNIYFGDRRTNPVVIEKWRSAVDVYERGADDAQLSAHAPSAMLHKAYVALLSNDFDGAEVAISDGLIACNRASNAFYEIKLWLLSAVMHLLRNSSVSELHDMRALVEKAIARCVTWGALRPYWAAFYTRAKLESALGLKSLARDSFLAASEQVHLLGRSTSGPRHIAFYDDLAITFAVNDWTIPTDVLRHIAEPSMQLRIAQISALRGDALEQFLASYEPTTSLNDGKTNMPLP